MKTLDSEFDKKYFSLATGFLDELYPGATEENVELVTDILESTYENLTELNPGLDKKELSYITYNSLFDVLRAEYWSQRDEQAQNI